jgi:beta-N-acetylhexosaminidase
VTARWGVGPAAVKAAQAGCDLLPVCATTEAQVEAIENVIRALEAETVSWSAMDDACARIRRLKERYLVPYRPPDPRAARAAAGSAGRADLSREIMDRSGMTA